MHKNLVIKGVECRLNENGVVESNLEHVARGLGFTQVARSGNEVVRWERVRAYLQGFSFIPTSGDGLYDAILDSRKAEVLKMCLKSIL